MRLVGHERQGVLLGSKGVQCEAHRPLLLRDSNGSQLERSGELCKGHCGPMVATIVVTMICNLIKNLVELLLAQVECQPRGLAHRPPAAQGER